MIKQREVYKCKSKNGMVDPDSVVKILWEEDGVTEFEIIEGRYTGKTIKAASSWIETHFTKMAN